MSRSRFTAYLRSLGYGHLAPSHNKQAPLCDRVIWLQRAGASESDVKLMMTLWDEWRGTGR